MIAEAAKADFRRPGRPRRRRRAGLEARYGKANGVATLTASRNSPRWTRIIAYLQVLGTMVDFSTFHARSDTADKGGSRWIPIRFLRELADSWALLVLFAVFLGVILWALPSRHRNVGAPRCRQIPIFRNEKQTRGVLGDKDLQAREGGVRHVQAKQVNRKLRPRSETTGHSLGRHRRVQQPSAALVGCGPLYADHRLGHLATPSPIRHGRC
jgi:hypothetical protein